MKYIKYKENRQHGTPDFPYAYYHITKTHPRYNMVYHWHPQYEIIYVNSGKFDLLINGIEYTVSENEAIFIPGGMMHGGMPENAEYECLVFEADTYFQRCLMMEEKTAAIISGINVQKPIIFNNNNIIKLIEQIFSEFRSRRKGYRLKVQGAVLQIFGEIVRLDDDDSAIVSKRRLNSFKKALTYIEKHYAEPISLDELASACGLNKGYLCRFFREMTHKTPIDYVNYYRIERACEQIATTDFSLTEIALSCGFCDLSYFIKVFKRYKGVAPSAYINCYINQ